MNTPIFDLLCLEYPEVFWWQDTESFYSLQGVCVREAFGQLRAIFHDD